ncbi:RagB/SusD family nutrient uptake outer membrane protein [Adhaeribacter arboris]|uniref:RagB/SusD family nutrient uptake outer membrane protein n=1 Tax=Adhaeribacter arboris TaxID=2072846 RepID=A0A2T2YPH7_9BACT|nr:RagB/SusD family nutrient uptake outer membrane protein [Adhaeribacter arboris]PSR57422.1 RagB/SusD family nutrient uptake outer membrane protein [Adhaeribacter arboris]
MKKYIINSFLAAGLVCLSTACDLTMDPYNGKSADTLLSSDTGVQTATFGNYSFLKDFEYTRSYHFLNEYPSDNVMLSGTTTDHLTFAYNYRHIESMTHTSNFWKKAYQLIYGTNKALEAIDSGTAPLAQATADQLKGENLYLRAMVHFNLVNLFGRPYAQDNGASPGIMIRKDADVTALPPRSSVKEVYDFIIADLLQAAELMKEVKNSSFASKEVAYALLSRIYLYQQDNAKAIEYADKVISSGRYKLLDTETYKRYFTLANESNPETIFAIRHTSLDDRGQSSIGSLYYSKNGAGYGEVYASAAYRALLDKYPADVRHSFYEPVYVLDAQGQITKDANGNPIIATRNGFPKYFINKYSNQENLVTLSSPVYLRLAEMYLNRAEANAKSGNDQAALDDVNLIRTRAGLTGEALYTLADLKGHASVLEVVLEERRIELAFEAQRKYDLFRNNLPLVRDYPGTHLLVGQTTQIVQPNDPRVIYFIPQLETVLNPNLVQNP